MVNSRRTAYPNHLRGDKAMRHKDLAITLIHKEGNSERI
jgi:hypothetical protein